MTQTRTSLRGFTLLELSVIIVIVGILAATAVPALSSARDARAAGAAEFIERRLLDARARALAQGRPVGLRLTPDAATLQTFEIATPGATPAAARTLLGEPEPVLALSAYFPNVTFTISGGDGATGAQTIWFAYDGTPQSRNASGAVLSPWVFDATVTASNGGGSVTVRRVSGAIER